MVSIFVNGKEYPLAEGQADKTLLVFLRGASCVHSLLDIVDDRS